MDDRKTEVTRRVSELAADQAGVAVSQISFDTDLISDLRFDTMARAGFALDLEEAFGMSIADEDLDSLRTVGQWAEYVLAALDVPPEVAAFIHQSMEGLRLQTAAHSSTWHMGQEQRWLVDQDTATIEFRFADGTVATAPVQIVGTFDPTNGTFLWAWDHPSVDPSLRVHADLVREYGRRHKITRFTTRKLVCTEQQAWEFTAVAVRLGHASGGYRANSGGPWVYMTYGEIRLKKSCGEAQGRSC